MEQMVELKNSRTSRTSARCLYMPLRTRSMSLKERGPSEAQIVGSMSLLWMEGWKGPGNIVEVLKADALPSRANVGVDEIREGVSGGDGVWVGVVPSFFILQLGRQRCWYGQGTPVGGYCILCIPAIVVCLAGGSDLIWSRWGMRAWKFIFKRAFTSCLIIRVGIWIVAWLTGNHQFWSEFVIVVLFPVFSGFSA